MWWNESKIDWHQFKLYVISINQKLIYLNYFTPEIHLHLLNDGVFYLCMKYAKKKRNKYICTQHANLIRNALIRTINIAQYWWSPEFSYMFQLLFFWLSLSNCFLFYFCCWCGCWFFVSHFADHNTYTHTYIH